MQGITRRDFVRQDRLLMIGLLLVLGITMLPEGVPRTASSTNVSNRLTCPGAITLEDLITCIIAQMPKAGSQGFVVPDDTVRDDWRGVVAQMLLGFCEDVALPDSLRDAYVIRWFNDVSTAQQYCVLMEVADEDGDGVVDRGWGTFIINPSPSRELSIQIAHPVADKDTEDEGIGVFKGTSSRSFLMAGTHRNANSITSTCQSTFLEADVAHNIVNLFQPTVQELLTFYNVIGTDFVGIQFHGDAPDSCPGVDVYLTHGLNRKSVAGDKILDLQSNLLAYHPAWHVDVPDPANPPCNLHGSTNVQGRLLNGVEPGSVCTVSASSSTGKFIHVEQKFAFRNAQDWVGPINDTWPSVSTRPRSQVIPWRGHRLGDSHEPKSLSTFDAIIDCSPLRLPCFHLGVAP
jgi:hypothetical protein